MKKIVSVLALSALVAGSVFAQAEPVPAEAAPEKPKAAETKVSINGNLRFGTNLFSVKKTGAEYNEEAKKTVADGKESKTTYGFNDLTKGAWGDDLVFKFSGGKAGVSMKMSVAPKTFSMSDAALWVKFGNSFKLNAGLYDTRGSIKRANPLDGNWWNNYCEVYKPGVVRLALNEKKNGLENKSFGVDSGNITTENGSKAGNLMGEYAINDNMNVRLALFQGSTETENPFEGFSAAGQFDMKHDKFNLTFTAKVKRTPAVAAIKEETAEADAVTVAVSKGYKKDNNGKFVYDTANNTFINYKKNDHEGWQRYSEIKSSGSMDIVLDPGSTVKLTQQKKVDAVDAKVSVSFGLFVNPILVENLDLLAGYTFATETLDDIAKNANHGIDVRAAYTTGAITLATLNNITINDSDIYSWHTLGFAYKVSDFLSAVGIQAKLESKDKSWGDNNDSATMNFRPYVDLTVMKNCMLSIGVDVGVSNFLDNGKKDPTINVDIPAVVRVKL